MTDPVDSEVLTVHGLLVLRKALGGRSLRTGLNTAFTLPRTLEGAEMIGGGCNATVYLCRVGGVRRVIKIPRPTSEAAINLRVEVIIQGELSRVGFPLVPLLESSDCYLLRPSLCPTGFGVNQKDLDAEQIRNLRQIFEMARHYAEVTGIPLDLKRENLWWDGEENRWLLADAGPRLDDGDTNKYAYTLDSASFEEYYRGHWKVGKKFPGTRQHLLEWDEEGAQLVTADDSTTIRRWPHKVTTYLGKESEPFPRSTSG